MMGSDRNLKAKVEFDQSVGFSSFFTMDKVHAHDAEPQCSDLILELLDF